MSYYVQGYIIRNIGLGDAVHRINSIANKCRESASISFKKRFVEKVINQLDLDQNYSSLEGDEKDTVLHIMKEVTEAQIGVEGKHERNTDWDFTYYVRLAEIDGNVLVYPVIENDGCYMDCLLNCEAEEYFWQNHTDKPDSIPSEEWDERENAWRRAGIIWNEGDLPRLRLTLVDWDDYANWIPNMKDLDPSLLPSDERRRRHVANMLTLMELFAAEGSVATASGDCSGIVKLVTKARKTCHPKMPDVLLWENF